MISKNTSRHGRVMAVSMMKDEGPYLLEWVAHQLALGFTDIVVYTNDCTDGTDEMLIRLEELGLAHHRVNRIPKGIRPQPSAIKAAARDPLVAESDWLIVFDADEFLCIKQGDGTLDGLIDAVEATGANGIVITWRIFGSNGVQDWSRAPVSEQYLRAAPQEWNRGWGVKTLFRFDPDHWKLGIHRPKIKNKHLKKGYADTVKWLNGSGRPMEEYFRFRGWRSIKRTIGYDWVQMNHYAVKSMDSYAIRKARGNVNAKADKYNADYWALQDRNEVLDASILRHAPRRAAILKTLLEDEVLHRLHVAALERVEARLAAFRATPAYDELICGLKRAAKVPIGRVDASPHRARNPDKVAARMTKVERETGALRASAGAGAEGSPPGGGALRELYRRGEIDLHADAPAPMTPNHDILMPADARVFTPAAIEAIANGKFERNHARNLPAMLPAGGAYLEVGAAAGFLAALIAKERPDVTVSAHEERPALAATARRVWQANALEPGPGRRLLTGALFRPDDGQNTASGLAALLADATPDLVYFGDPRLTPAMIADALAAAEHLPATLICGGRLMVEADEGEAALAEALAGALRVQGYAPASDQPLSAALVLRHGRIS